MADRAWLICDSEGMRVQHYQESVDAINSDAEALAAYRAEFGETGAEFRAIEVSADAL